MKTPPLLLAAALLLWGWQTGYWIVAALLAAILEGSRLVRARWEFSQTDFNRIWNLCALLVAGAAIYVFAANEGASAMTGLFDTPARRNEALTKTARSVLVLFQWLPMVFFPAMAAQAFSRRDQVDFTAFSWVLRRWQARRPDLRPGGINVSYLYFAFVVFAASATRGSSIWFFAALSLLFGWALWVTRPRRYSALAWSAALAAVVAAGFAGQFALVHLQRVVQNLDTAFLSRFAGKALDPKESRTALGSIGRLKLSGRIVLRVETDGPPPPTHLREASYNLFRNRLWAASSKDFNYLNSETNETSWVFLPEKHSKHSVTIAQYLDDGKGLLALPNGTAQLDELAAFSLQTNRLGVAMAVGPGLVRYRSRYDEGATFDSAPVAEDWTVPDSEEATIAQVAAGLGLKPGLEPRRALQIVAAYFQNHFEYSSYLTGDHQSVPGQTPLAVFLLKTRAGHCEYFATATALLLRKADLPTRYAVGYAVTEASGKKWVVRQRHGHAWCLVHYDGAWHDFDTTPASWNAVEGQHASWWEPISDAFSRLWFEFSKWRWGTTNLRGYLLWIFLPVLLLVAGRLFFKKQWTRFQQPKPGGKARELPGLDSEFYLIEQRLADLGLERRSHETPAHWLKRIAPAAPARFAPLAGLLALHYRHRFDPAGLAPSERATLRSATRAWLEQGGHETAAARTGGAG